jgi:MFS family permease
MIDQCGITSCECATDTVLSPYASSTLAWSQLDCALWFSAGAVLSLVGSLLMKHLVVSVKVPDKKLSLVNQVVMALLVVVLAVNQTFARPSAWLAVVTMGVLCGQIPGQMGILNGLLARIVPPSTASVLLSLLLTAGTLARIFGPLLGGNFAYFIVWWVLFAVTALGMLLHCWEYSRLGTLITLEPPSTITEPLLSNAESP